MAGIRLPDINLVGATVGQKISLVLAPGTYQPGTYRQNTSQQYATMRIFNESGVGLDYMVLGLSTGIVPAGGWYDIEMQPDVQKIDFFVSYLIASAPVSLLKSIYYKPGEVVPPMPVLGNSPLGVSGAIGTTATTLSNEGNAPGTLVIDMGPTGSPNQVNFFNNGVMDTTATYTINNTNTGQSWVFDGTGGFTASGLLGTDAYVEWFGAKNWTLRPAAGTLLLSDLFDGQSWTFDATGGFTASGLLASDAYLTVGTNVKSINGQATAGNFGVPMIVAQVQRFNVITTGLQTVLTSPSLPAGLYQVNGYIYMGQVATEALVFEVAYTDPDVGGIVAAYMACLGAGTSPLQLNALNNFTGKTQIACLPMNIYISNNTTIAIKYNDPGGSPNDFVTAVIERLL